MTNKELAIPSGAITGVVVLAVVGVAAIAGVALKAGIAIGQISRKHADKKSAKTGEWVEPNIPEALTDALGKFMAKGTVNAGKKVILHGTKKTGQVIGSKFGIPANVTSTVSTDIIDFFKRMTEEKEAVSPESTEPETVIVAIVEDETGESTPTIITFIDESPVLDADEKEATEETPFFLVNTDTIFIDGKTIPTSPVIEEPVIIGKKEEPVLPKIDFSKATSALSNALTEENLDTLIKTVSANKGRLINALNKKINEAKK